MTAPLPKPEDLPLAGARIRQARWNPGGRVLELLLRCEDAARGAVDLLLRYRGVQLLEPALPQLAALVEEVTASVRTSRAEAAGGLPEHRLGLAPQGEIVVRFGAVDIAETLAPGGDYGEPVVRFQVLSC